MGRKVVCSHLKVLTNWHNTVVLSYIFCGSDQNISQAAFFLQATHWVTPDSHCYLIVKGSTLIAKLKTDVKYFPLDDISRIIFGSKQKEEKIRSIDMQINPWHTHTAAVKYRMMINNSLKYLIVNCASPLVVSWGSGDVWGLSECPLGEARGCLIDPPLLEHWEIGLPSGEMATSIRCYQNHKKENDIYNFSLQFFSFSFFNCWISARSVF